MNGTGECHRFLDEEMGKNQRIGKRMKEQIESNKDPKLKRRETLRVITRIDLNERNLS